MMSFENCIRRRIPIFWRHVYKHRIKHINLKQQLKLVIRTEYPSPYCSKRPACSNLEHITLNWNRHVNWNDIGIYSIPIRNFICEILQPNSFLYIIPLNTLKFFGPICVKSVKIIWNFEKIIQIKERNSINFSYFLANSY